MKQKIRGFSGLLALVVACSAEPGVDAVGDEGEQVAAIESALYLNQNPTWYVASQCKRTDDFGTEWTLMCCPQGTVMIGARLDQGRLKCASVPSYYSLGPGYIDGPDGIGNHIATQRAGMHACPRGSAMVGLLPSRNDLLCANFSALPLNGPEATDGGTQDNVGHVCPPAYPHPPLSATTYSNGEVMTGIHIDNNWFRCAS